MIYYWTHPIGAGMKIGILSGKKKLKFKLLISSSTYLIFGLGIVARATFFSFVCLFHQMYQHASCWMREEDVRDTGGDGFAEEANAQMDFIESKVSIFLGRELTEEDAAFLDFVADEWLPTKPLNLTNLKVLFDKTFKTPIRPPAQPNLRAPQKTTQPTQETIAAVLMPRRLFEEDSAELPDSWEDLKN